MTLLLAAEGQGEHVPLADRGLAYGDGLFETMAVVDGRVRLLAQHLQRLENGLQRLGVAALSAAQLAPRIEEAARLSRGLPGGAASACLKLLVTRGEGPRGYAPPAPAEPRWWLQGFPWTPPASGHAPARVVISSVRLAHQPLLAGLKHLNRLEQVLARQALPAESADEALLLDGDGQPVCAIAANVFIVRRGQLLTPRVDRCGVAGVVRAALLEAGRDGRIPFAVTECHLSLEELATADEVFLTSALRGVWSVGSLAGRVLQAGPVARELAAWWSGL